MRITVLAHALRTAGGLSVGRGLIASMIEVAPQEEYSFIVPNRVGYEEICSLAALAHTHATSPMTSLQRLRFDRTELLKMIDAFEPDVVLGLDSGHALLTSRWPQAILVQDAHLFYPPHHYGPVSRKNRIRHAYLKWHFTRSLRYVPLVFTQTNVVAKRLRAGHNYNGRISVCGAAVSPVLRGSIRSQHPMPTEFARHASRFKLFYPARYYPHKNIERIVEMFQRHRAELGNVSVFLTISVAHHPNVASVLRLIENLGLNDHIVTLGELPHEALAPYYAHSDALFMPTLLESVGFPYLEGMECGLPVITSDLDFAHELCGEAAAYFDPWDPGSIKDGILRVVNDEGLRVHLSRNAGRRVQPVHSWHDVATEVVADLRMISASHV